MAEEQDKPNWRDPSGVVHVAYGDIDPEMRVTLCEYQNEVIEPLYESETLMLTRAPVSCLVCMHMVDERDNPPPKRNRKAPAPRTR